MPPTVSRKNNVPSAEERLATLEAEMRNVSSNVAQISASIRILEQIASKGGGALHASLFIGGLLGWLIGFGATIYAALHR